MTLSFEEWLFQWEEIGMAYFFDYCLGRKR